MSKLAQIIIKGFASNQNIEEFFKELELKLQKITEGYEYQYENNFVVISKEELMEILEIQICKKYINSNKFIPENKILNYGANKNKLVLESLISWQDFMDSKIKHYCKNKYKDKNILSDMYRYKDSFRDTIIRYLALKEINEQRVTLSKV